LYSSLDTGLGVGNTTGVAEYQTAVREYREKAGLSQEALARKVDVSRQTIVNIEQGRNEPRVFLAIAIAAALGGIALSELFRKEVSS
jgi:putative transcriptional regulator